MRRVLLVLASLVVLALLAAGGAALYVVRAAEAFAVAPCAPGAPVDAVVTIPRGASVHDVARALHESNLCADEERLFYWMRYARREQAGRIKSGEYALRSSMSPEELLGKLVRGEVTTVRFTVPEGLNLWEVAPLVAKSGLVGEQEFLAYTRSEAAARALGLPAEATNLEGYLYPDTYQFARGVGVADIAAAMVKKHRAVFDADVRPRLQAAGLTEHQAVTLASIVEKETGAPEERPRISAVFHNRMRQGMKLQTDPTVIYSVRVAGLPWDGNLRRADLERDVPYNTYARPGLPPGPIAGPGRAALVAAVAPADVKDVFFVSRNDGTHEFCPTLDCHNKAVEVWQREYFRKQRRDRAQK